MYDDLEAEIINFVDAKNIDILYVGSSSFAQYFCSAFSNTVIDSLKSVMKDKTIIMPAFSFDFCDRGVYSVKHSKTFCGGVASLFLKDSCVERSMYPPTHNVAIWGKLTKNLLNKEYSTSFGHDSIFFQLNKYKTAVLLIDCSFDDGVPFVHCLEDRFHSNYRYKKKFSGTIINKDNKRIWYEYERDVRRRGVILSAEKLGEMFYSTKYVKIKRYEMSQFVYFDLQDFYHFFDPIFKNNPNIMECGYED